MLSGDGGQRVPAGTRGQAEHQKQIWPRRENPSCIEKQEGSDYLPGQGLAYLPRSAARRARRFMPAIC